MSGNFDLIFEKIRPGTYINFESSRYNRGDGRDGIVTFPLINHDYGPGGEFILVTSTAPNAQYRKLGHFVGDDHPSMLLIREALKKAFGALVYIPREGAKAAATAGDVTATAAYGGSRGNSLKFVIADDPYGDYDVTIYMDTEAVFEYRGVSTIEELTPNGWIDFSGTGALSAVAGVTLSGGTDGVATNGDITKYFDDAEGQMWSAIALPLMPTGDAPDPTVALQAALKAKIHYMRENAGKKRVAVMANYNADYEGVINVTNGVVLNDGTILNAGLATVWVAALDASSPPTKSNTYEVYEGAAGIAGVKSTTESEDAILNGELFFTSANDGSVVVEYDINSLLSYNSSKDETWRKNRSRRIYDMFAERLALEFKPGKFDNTPEGWDVMEGIGRSLLKMFAEMPAIINVDYKNDFVVDRGMSKDDRTYFNVGIQAIESAEKAYFTVSTR